MDRLLPDGSTLEPALLAADEERYDKQALQIVQTLSTIAPADLAAAKDDLDTLSPSTQTIAYLYLLHATIDASVASGKAAPRQLPAAVLPEGALWQYVVNGLLEFDQIQVRYCGGQLLKLVEYVSKGAEQTTNFIPAIQLLHHVILRLDGTSSTLTSTHRTFVRLCLLTQAYAEAAAILDRPIYHIPSPQQDSRSYKFLCSPQDQSSTYLTPATGLTHPITTKIYLEYFLLGGMCYLATRRYKEAFDFFEIVLIAPANQNAVSMIMVDAYRKWLLVGLLLNGTPPAVPRGVGPSAIKNIRAIAKPYDCVADAFKANDIDKLRAEIEAGNQLWQDDGNYGLMIEVYAAFRKFAVLRLGKTFDAVPFTEIASRAPLDLSSLDESVSYLQDLTAAGQLDAEIQEAQGVKTLHFSAASTPTLSETEIEKHLAIRTQELQLLLKHITDTEHRLEISKEYIDYLRKLKKIKEDEKKNSVGAPNGRNADDVDEDMMEEL